MGHLFFRAFIFSVIQIIKPKIYSQNTKAKTPFQ